MSDELSGPMTPIERVRCALAMADAGYQWDVQIEDVAELLQAYDEAHSDYLRRHKNACDYWMALKQIDDLVDSAFATGQGT